LKLGGKVNSIDLTVTGHAFQGSHIKLYCVSSLDHKLELFVKVGSEYQVHNGAKISVGIEQEHVILITDSLRIA
jgi:hypothetical protein